MNKTQYWTKFWEDYGRAVVGEDEQTQVLRTSNKKPISGELWSMTLDMLADQLKISKEDEVLELCCGNGLISRYFAHNCQCVTSVDVSKDLLMQLDRCAHSNVKTIAEDVRVVDFPEGSFSKIVMYAGIQYLTIDESIPLMKKVFGWLKPGGLFYIGDIPDSERMWHFYDSPDREKVYFDNLIAGTPIVGTWYDSIFLEKVGAYAGFSHGELIPQHDDLIYSKFRYDYKYTK